MARYVTIFYFMFFCLTALADVPVKIIYIGDSHAHGGLGLAGGLDSLLREDPHVQLSFHAGCGTTSQQWLEGGRAPCGMNRPYLFRDFDGRRGGGKSVTKYADLRGEFEGVLGIVQLGTNFWGWSPQAIANSVRRLLSEVQRQNGICVWIGPPGVDEAKTSRHYPGLTNAKIDRVESAIQDALGDGCPYLSSREFVADGADGVHFQRDTGRAWARWIHEILIQRF